MCIDGSVEPVDAGRVAGGEGLLQRFVEQLVLGRTARPLAKRRGGSLAATGGGGFGCSS